MRTLIFSTLILFSSNLFASEWILLTKKNQLDSIKIDKTSIEAETNGAISAWFIFNNISKCESAKKDPNRLDTFFICDSLSSKIKYNFNCARKTLLLSRQVKYSGIDGQGELLSDIENKDTTFQSAIPDTAGSAILKAACLRVNHTTHTKPRTYT